MEQEIVKELIKEEILSFYQNLYTDEENWRLTTFGWMGCLTTEEKEGLEATFGEEEVLVAVTSCAIAEAPGHSWFYNSTLTYELEHN